MFLRDYTSKDSAVICKWITSEEEMYKWSSDRFNKYPLMDDDIDKKYAPQVTGGRFIPLMAADENGIAVGHFIIRYPSENDDSVIRFIFVVVSPDVRGKGYGREMLRLGMEYAREKLEVKKVELGVYANNDKARRCYESLGFKEYNRRNVDLPVGVWECIDMEITL